MKLQIATTMSVYQQVEELFDELAEYYNLLYPNIQNFNQEIAKELHKKILTPRKIKKIHECACGTGHMAIELARLGYDITGSDISGKMIEKSKYNAYQAGVDVKFYHSNILELTTNFNEEYDLVICKGNSFSHIQPNDYKLALKNMCNILKKGGFCYIDTRDWELLIHEKPLIEHRAHFRLGSKDIVSYYLLDYKENHRTYNIIFVFFDRKSNVVSHKLIIIDGFYVFENKLINTFEETRFGNLEKLKLDNENKNINIYIGKKE